MKRMTTIVLALGIALSAWCCLAPAGDGAWAEAGETSSEHAGEGGHHGGGINWYQFGRETPPLIANIVNLAIMLFILWYFARKPAREYFRERSLKVRAAIDDSEKTKREAEEKYRQVSDKLDAIEEEMQALKKELIASAVAENERVIAEARSQADLVRANALRLIEQEKEVMLENLKRDIAGRVVQRAREILKAKISKQDHDRMTRETIDFYSRSTQG
jgi:F-type H+-transporting ATPase subunit b